MADMKFIEGLIVKAPNERAPEYVKAKISIKRQDLIAWLSAQDGEWINADLKVSQNGKWYAAVDEWKPESRGGGRPANREARQPARSAAPGDDLGDDLPPFATNRGTW